MSGEKIPEEFNTKFSQFMSGTKRTFASQKSEIGEILYGGKKSSIYEVYKKLLELLSEVEGE